VMCLWPTLEYEDELHDGTIKVVVLWVVTSGWRWR